MKNLFLYCSLASTLCACSNASLMNAIPDNRPDYKTSRTTNPLEIPPDLTQSSVDDGLVVSELSATDDASLADYQNERGVKVNRNKPLENALQNIQHSGDATWIEIDQLPDTVFENAKRFWLDNGLTLSRVDKNIGIMETDWLENKANLPTSGISAMIGRVLSGLQDEGVRDKFRTRIDYDGNRSSIYLTHYGATEQEINQYGQVVNSQTGSAKDSPNDYVWKASTRNPELEVEMLRRLNVFLHKRGKQTAVAPVKNTTKEHITFSQLADGTPALLIDSNFNRAWLLLGIAIDRAGYSIDRKNRQGGTYTFAKITERRVGFIVKHTERTIETYQIGLADQGNRQIAVIRRIDGKRPASEQSRAILQKISQEIQF